MLIDVIGTEVHDEVAAGNFLIAQLVVEELLAIPVVRPDTEAGTTISTGPSSCRTGSGATYAAG